MNDDEQLCQALQDNVFELDSMTFRVVNIEKKQIGKRTAMQTVESFTLQQIGNALGADVHWTKCAELKRTKSEWLEAIPQMITIKPSGLNEAFEANQETNKVVAGTLEIQKSSSPYSPLADSDQYNDEG